MKKTFPQITVTMLTSEHITSMNPIVVAAFSLSLWLSLALVGFSNYAEAQSLSVLLITSHRRKCDGFASLFRSNV